jgi:hypothetical protein
MLTPEFPGGLVGNPLGPQRTRPTVLHSFDAWNRQQATDQAERCCWGPRVGLFDARGIPVYGGYGEQGGTQIVWLTAIGPSLGPR